MAGLKELRNRIAAIKSTEKITSAMKMVAAARLRKAQDLLAQSEPCRRILYTIAGRIQAARNRRAQETGIAPLLPEICRPHETDANRLLLVFSSDRGLCGSYNAMIARTAVKRIEELLAAGKKVRIICWGQRCYNALKRNYADMIAEHYEAVSGGGISYAAAAGLASRLAAQFAAGEIDVCEAVYSHFASAVRRENRCRLILPLPTEIFAKAEVSDMYEDAFFESEPDDKTLLTTILPQIFSELIFEIMIHSEASEQGARMTSMDNATRNAGDMISRLTLRYNRIRQTAITTELVEIIAGAEAI